MDTNDTPNPGHRPEPAPGPSRSASDGFFTWLRGLAIVRSDDRWIGGVAGGLAARAGIDPLIVRGIFVALALVGGPGILLYLIGWFLLPDATGRIEAERLIRGGSSGVGVAIVTVIGLLVLVPIVIGVGGWFTGGVLSWDLWTYFGIPEWIPIVFTVLWWLLITAGIIWVVLLIIARSTSKVNQEEAERAARAWGERTAQQATEWGSHLSEKSGEWGKNAGAKANEWGQKAGTWGAQAGEGVHHAAAQVNEWTDRELEEHRRSRLDPAHTILSLGVALLAGGAAAAIVTTEGYEVSALLVGILAAVTVLGLSLIVAGLRGRRAGWLGFWSTVGIIAVLWAAFVPPNTELRAFGELDRNIVSLESGTQTGVAMIAGETTVDLRDLGQTGGTLDVYMVAGSVTLLLPDDDAPVRVEARTAAGRQNMLSRDGSETILSSPLLSQTTGISAKSGDRASETTVRIWVLAGNTTVRGTEWNSRTPIPAADAATAHPNAPTILEATR